MKKLLEIVSVLGTVKDFVEKFADKIVDKIKTNKFSNDDLVNLFNANNELLKAVLNNDYKD